MEKRSKNPDFAGFKNNQAVYIFYKVMFMKSKFDYLKLYRSFIDSSEDLIYLKDHKHRYVMTNKKGAEFFGLSESEILGKTDIELMLPDAAEKCFETDDTAFKSEYPVVSEELVENRIFETRKFPVLIDKEKYIGMYIRDVTDERNVEKELLDSIKDYKELVDNAKSIILKFDKKGIINFINPYALDIFGYSKGEIFGKNVVGTIVPYTDSAGKNLQKMIENIIKFPEKYKNNQNENISKTGERKWISWTNSPIYDIHGEYTGILSIGNDITSIRKYQQELFASEQKFMAAFKRSPALMSISDIETGEFFDINDIFLETLGYSHDEVVGKTSRELDLFCDQEDREKMIKIIKKMGYTRNLKISVKAKNSQIRECNISADIIENQDKNYLLIAASDETEQRNAERELKASEEKYKAIFENTGAATVIIENDAIISLANAEFLNLSGYAKDEIEGKMKWTDFVPEYELERMMEQHTKRRENLGIAEKSYEFVFIDRYGKEKNILLHIDMVSDTKQSVASLIDITYMKKIQYQREVALNFYKLLNSRRTDDAENYLLSIEKESDKR